MTRTDADADAVTLSRGSVSVNYLGNEKIGNLAIRILERGNVVMADPSYYLSSRCSCALSGAILSRFSHRPCWRSLACCR